MNDHTDTPRWTCLGCRSAAHLRRHRCGDAFCRMIVCGRCNARARQVVAR